MLTESFLLLPFTCIAGLMISLETAETLSVDERFSEISDTESTFAS